MASYKIFQNGEQINTIEATQVFVMAYCGSQPGLTYELVPEPEPAESEPDTEADLLETALDHEARLSALELLTGGDG